MPTYEYQCRACRHRFDLFQSMSDAPKRKCPKCGRSALERLIGTGAAVIFKGSGFYQTDYRSDSYKKAAEAESKPAETKAAETKAAEPSAADAKPGADKPKPPSPAPAPAARAESKSAPRPARPKRPKG